MAAASPMVASGVYSETLARVGGEARQVADERRKRGLREEQRGGGRRERGVELRRRRDVRDIALAVGSANPPLLNDILSARLKRTRNHGIFF